MKRILGLDLSFRRKAQLKLNKNLSSEDYRAYNIFSKFVMYLVFLYVLDVLGLENDF